MIAEAMKQPIGIVVRFPQEMFFHYTNSDKVASFIHDIIFYD